MKRLFLICGLTFLLGMPLWGQQALRKDRLFKVDPVGGLFKEFRVAYEQRLFKEYWWYLSPHLFHQAWLPRPNDSWGRPANPQKYFGAGMRFGGRRYFSGNSPMGLFLHVSGSYRHTWVNQMAEDLSMVGRDRFNSMGIGAMVGWQNLFSPRPWTTAKRINLAYGAMVGLEYNRHFGEDYEADRFIQNWYDFPFGWKPDFLNGFRFYLGVEIGFAMLQRSLRW